MSKRKHPAELSEAKQKEHATRMELGPRLPRSRRAPDEPTAPPPLGGGHRIRRVGHRDPSAGR